MQKILYVGSFISIFLIILASILGIVELFNDYSKSGLFLSLNGFFYSTILFLVEKYSNYVTIYNNTNKHTTINEYTFRFIFHTWGGLTLIGTSDAGGFISIVVILYGVGNLVYNVKFNNGGPNTATDNISNITNITEDAFKPSESLSDNDPFNDPF